jgi:ketosteroid isomerase-like protein
MMNTVDFSTTASELLHLERAALDRWGRGDPGGVLKLYAPDISYFDPLTASRLDGHEAMEDYYRPWTGKIHIARYDIVNPQVVVDATMALVTYNLVNYRRGDAGHDVVASRWNNTSVYQRRGAAWKLIHSHWSFTEHPAFQHMTPEASEGLSNADSLPAGQ